MKTNSRIKYTFRILTALAWLVIPVSLFAGGGSPTVLLSPVPATATLSASRAPAAGVPLELNAAVLQPGVVTAGDALIIEPSPGTIFTVLVSKISIDINGTLSWRGQVEGHPNGYFLLSASDGQVLGSIELPDENARYLIQYNPAAMRHMAYDSVPTDWKELDDAPSPVPPTNSLNVESAPQSVSDASSDSQNIDVMVVYTPNARVWAGGVSGINNVIAQVIQRGQLAIDNTAIPVTVRLVHSAEITYTESGNSGTDLTRLTATSDGYMDTVHTWRTTYAADIVVLLEQIDDTGGLGWLLSSTGGQPAYAFSITRVQQASFTYTTIHEMGHNMGCHHRRDQATQPGPGLYPYSAGWHWTGTNAGKYASVMSYEDGGYARVAYFSSPTNYYQGAATGTADDDNARTIQNIKGVIAAYRTAVSTNAFSFWTVALTNNVVLRWIDPTTCGVSTRSVHIRSRTDAYPTNITDGSLVYEGTNLVHIHTNLISGQLYYYTIWVSDDGSTFIDPP